jgi:nucleotide-binding universal stress UspA family protein
MPTLQTILVPLDGSPPSLHALEHAIVLAEDYDATLIALHVVSPDTTLAPNVRDESERSIDGALQRAEESLVRHVIRRTVDGDPVAEIIQAAGEADLIVMGTHGRIGRLQSILGSTAASVMRNAPCPVLTVRDATAYQSFQDRRHHRPLVADEARRREPSA